MTAPLTTLRSKRRLSSSSAWGGKRNLLRAEGRYLADDIAEWLMDKEHRENFALALLAIGCIAGIWVIGRV